MTSRAGLPFHRLISACLCLSLSVTAFVCLWFYYTNTTNMLHDSAQDHTRQLRKLTSLVLENRQAELEHVLSILQQDQQLNQLTLQQSSLVVESTNYEHLTRQIHQRLNELLSTYATDLDLLLFVPIRGGKEIIAGHSSYHLDNMITELRNHLPNLGAQLFTPNSEFSGVAYHNIASGMAYSKELIGGPLNKRLGYLFGINLFNNNVQLLRRIVNNTGVDGATLVIQPSSDPKVAVTGTSRDHANGSLEPIAWMNQVGTTPIYQANDEYPDEHFSVIDLLGDHDIAHQDATQLQLILWQKESYLTSHYQLFTQTLILVVGLVLLLGTGIAVLATKISSRSLNYLTKFAEKQTSDTDTPHFEATPIYEINQVGRRLEQAMQDVVSNEEMYRNILNYSGSVVYIKTLDGRYQFVNSEFECVTGIPHSEVYGKTNEDIFPPRVAEEFTNHDNKVLQEMRVLNFREDLVKDGETFSFISVKFPIKNQQGDIIYICGFLTDITGIIQTQEELSREKARAEEATTQLNSLNKSLADAITKKTMELESTQESLIQSEKLASLGSLVAGISHELNTPIGTALTVSTTLEERIAHLHEDFLSGSLSKRAMENYLQDLNESSSILIRSLSSAIELISSFKQLSVDQTSAQRRTFSLKKTLEEVAITHRHLLSDSPIQLIAMIYEDAQLDSYPGALVQVMNNLIHNAINHGFADDFKGNIIITTKLEAGHAIINISDNGYGIPAESQKKVFDPFFTTKLGQGGSGLGLHIVHSIVTGILGGSIVLNSRHGGVNTGTDFQITLPLIAPHHTEASHSKASITETSNT
ncbi:PAS domain-containing sensor histidine kinase [Litoribrevibacter albus]|nr:PAS domain-containing sensor histidine kinase [Litoribrevibacter albus]